MESAPSGAPLEPVKPRERILQEEAFLLIFRFCLFSAAVAAIYFGYLAMQVEQAGRVVPTGYQHWQWGVRCFLIIELVYYLWISHAFRHFRDWGLAVWVFGLAATVFSFVFDLN